MRAVIANGVVTVAAAFTSFTAHASAPTTPVPEPGIWSLLAIGVVGLIVGARFWRKK